MSQEQLPSVHPRLVQPVRLAAIAALIGAAALAGPIVVAAQTAPLRHHHHLADKTAAEARQSMEDRVSTLHSSLNITPEEETKWAAVAQVMRDNEADMQRLVVARRSDTAARYSAIDDLKTYEHFTQAHVNGLKNLITAFEVLYAAMPPSQQAVTDQVFTSFGHDDRSLKS